MRGQTVPGFRDPEDGRPLGVGARGQTAPGCGGPGTVVLEKTHPKFNLHTTHACMYMHRSGKNGKCIVGNTTMHSDICLTLMFK